MEEKVYRMGILALKSFGCIFGILFGACAVDAIIEYKKKDGD